MQFIKGVVTKKLENHLGCDDHLLSINYLRFTIVNSVDFVCFLLLICDETAQPTFQTIAFVLTLLSTYPTDLTLTKKLLNKRKTK